MLRPTGCSKIVLHSSTLHRLQDLKEFKHDMAGKVTGLGGAEEWQLA